MLRLRGRHPDEARDAAASAAGTVSCGNHLCRNLVQLYVCRGWAVASLRLHGTEMGQVAY